MTGKIYHLTFNPPTDGEDGTAAEDGVGTSFASSLPCLEFRFQPLGEVVQQLVTCGGLLSSVSAKLNA